MIAAILHSKDWPWYGVTVVSLLVGFLLYLVAFIFVGAIFDERRARKEVKKIDAIRDAWKTADFTSNTGQVYTSGTPMYTMTTTTNTTTTTPQWNWLDSIAADEQEAGRPIEWPYTGSQSAVAYINELHELIKDLQEQFDDLVKDQ